MIDHLQKAGGYTGSGLTLNEKLELETLRKDISKYRDLEASSKNPRESTENHTDSEDDDDDVIDDYVVEQAIKRTTQFGQRIAVSAEVYGEFNKKSDFKGKVIPKTSVQEQRIKLKILQSFLFENLEKDDIKIVIDAMEEKKFR